jgi:hypothetical protein
VQYSAAQSGFSHPQVALQSDNCGLRHGTMTRLLGQRLFKNRRQVCRKGQHGWFAQQFNAQLTCAICHVA